MSNTNNLILDTDYPVDKIIWFYQLDSTYKSDTVEIEHNLGTTPLCIGVYSDDNWTTTHSIIGSITQYLISDSTKITLRIYDTSQVGTAIKIRIFGFAKANDQTLFSSTSDKASKMMFDSQYNYLKLVTKGSVTADSSGNASVTHDLNALPFVMAWKKFDGGWLQVESSMAMTGYSPSSQYTDTTKTGVEVTDTQLKFYNLGDNEDIEYRIYKNEY